MITQQHVRMSAVAVALAALIGAVSYTAAAQETQPMTLFVTSVGLGDGANLSGLDGADAHCQSLAATVGRGDATWRAYLSTQGENAVNARDRIGNGPWYAHGGRRQIAADLGWLHGDTLDQARLGNAIGKRVIRSTASATRPTSTTSSPARGPTGRRSRTARTTPAATGRATATDRRRSGTPTGKVAATVRGTRRIRVAAAARRTWFRPAAPDSSTASRATSASGRRKDAPAAGSHPIRRGPSARRAGYGWPMRVLCVDTHCHRPSRRTQTSV